MLEPLGGRLSEVELRLPNERLSLERDFEPRDTLLRDDSSAADDSLTDENDLHDP